MNNKPRVLLVDDDAVNLRFLERVLGDNYEVQATDNGYEAIRLVKACPPDIILLDVMMPQLSGFEVCEIIRQEEKFRNIPILFLTGLDNAANHVASLDLGGVDYLLKPFNIVNLQLRVRNYVEMKRRHDQIRIQHDELARQKTILEHEIDERRVLEAKTQQMARMSALGEMASGIAHEVNNPITGVINCAELLKSRLPADHACQDIVDRILREGTRIAKIVKALLSTTHPGARRAELVTALECINPVLLLSRDTLASHGIALHLDLAEDLPLIRVERQLIEQLLFNLIGNACHALNARYPDATPEKQLHLCAAQRITDKGERLRLEVFDTGIGIPEEIIGKVFDPFFTTKPAGVGTGLGLSLCYEIVKQHGGEIRVESEPGSYTRFIVELPLHKA